ncbi:hypothetical protein WJX81_001109 [Elliptochloris bilobata]|uniref:C3H1-type domain-containing protein n=1 Tax=Elliptochloris bilobata TaxID=381761 RepID=A0AAW1QJU6_9CHLO
MRDDPGCIHAEHFKTDGHKVLRRALCLKDDQAMSVTATAEASDNSEEGSAASASESADTALADTAASATEQARQRGIPQLWRSLRQLHRPAALAARRGSPVKAAARAGSPGLARGSPAKAVPSETRVSASPRAADLIPAGTRKGWEEDAVAGLAAASAERAYEALALAAPTKGEVLPWVWLLRAFAERWSVASMATSIAYLARVAKHIAPEAEWLRLLCEELQPVMAHLQDNLPSRSLQAALQAVADRALQVGEAAIAAFRLHRSSRAENAAILRQAVRVVALVTRCAVTDGADLSGLLEAQLLAAAHVRCRALMATVGAPPICSPTSPKAARSLRGLAAAVEQLAQDITDDAESYQAALPTACGLSLPAIAARVYGPAVRAELDSVLAERPPADRAFFDLFEAVNAFEQVALTWCPTLAGEHGLFVDSAGVPVFLAPLEAYMMGVRVKLLQWSDRLLAEEAWAPVAGAGALCSRALVEVFTALAAVAEGNARVAAVGATYAALLERALVKVAMHHTAFLERLCQEEMPARLARRGGLLGLRGRPPSASAQRGWRPSRRLCTLLNDLREARCRQAELCATLRACLPDGWWGAPVGSRLALGDRFRLCQVDTERRYAAALHQAVKRLMEPLVPELDALLAPQAPPLAPQPLAAARTPLQNPGSPVGDAAGCAEDAAARCSPLLAALKGHLSALEPLMDERVLRRAAREAWNCVGGHMHDALDEHGEGENEDVRSLDQIGPRLQLADAILMHLRAWFTSPGAGALMDVDEPESVQRLRKMLALFLSSPEEFASAHSTEGLAWATAPGPPRACFDDGPESRASALRRRFAALDARLAASIEREDRRVQTLIEALLYTFLPAALAAVAAGASEDLAAELLPERCQVVASAALAAAALLNLPHWFLEFLLCLPWARLGDLYRRSSGPEPLMAKLTVTDTERRRLAKARLAEPLLGELVRFVLRPEVADSLPPLARLPGAAPGEEADALAALLDGATPLHCAAIRGNPAQVDHLLFCGADVAAATAAGETAAELVPLCGDRGAAGQPPGQRACRCMSAADGQVWECRSRLARALVVQRGCVVWAAGLLAWARLLLLGLACLLGLAGCATALLRPAVERHAAHRAAARRAAARERALGLVREMRAAARAGRVHLDAAKQLASGSLAALPACGHDIGDAPAEAQDSLLLLLPAAGGNGRARTRCEKAAALGEAAEQAYQCHLRAVAALQALDAREGCLAAGLPEPGLAERAAEDLAVLLAAAGVEWHVRGDEAAAALAGWADAALLKFRACGCLGCAALAEVAVRGAHSGCVCLFQRAERVRATRRSASGWRAVGGHLARTLHAHACLLLCTAAWRSPCRTAVAQAQQCLQDWRQLVRWGLAGGAGAGLGDADVAVACLEAWARQAEADLALAEALAGAPMAPAQPLAAALPSLLSLSPSGRVFLARPVGRDTAQRLETALAVAPDASPRLAELTRAAARSAAGELAAADMLRDVAAGRVAGGGSSMEALSAAIDAAEGYPNLQEDAAAARQLRERWERRDEAVAALEAVMANAREGALAAAIEAARRANIGVGRAKRLLKDMQAQAAAAAAARRLGSVLAARPAGSGMLKAELARAEAAAAAAAGGGGRGDGVALLAPALAAARRQLEVERAAEGLARAVSGTAAVADLPRLEAAILAARRVGAEQLEPAAFRAAGELRAELEAAARARSALETAQRALDRHCREEDAAAIDAAAAAAEAAAGGLLAEDVARAREAAARWRAAAAAEARLVRALREGAPASALARCIQDAAAAGVRVGEAKRMLKLVAGLEAALAAAADGPGGLPALRARLEAASAAGVAPRLLSAARAQLRRTSLMEASATLEAALRPRMDRGHAARCGVLKSVLDAADLLLGPARLVDEARGVLAEAAAAAAAAEAVRAEELRAKRERQRAERAERERERAERAERDKAERERAEKGRAERRERERVGRQRALQEHAALRERARREKAVMERLAREREEAVAATAWQQARLAATQHRAALAVKAQLIAEASEGGVLERNLLSRVDPFASTASQSLESLGLLGSASQEPGTPSERQSDDACAFADPGAGPELEALRAPRPAWVAAWGGTGTPASLLSSAASTEDALGRPFSPAAAPSAGGASSEGGAAVERSAGSGASASALLRGRLPDLGGAAWGDFSARGGGGGGGGGPARVLSPMGLVSQGVLDQSEAAGAFGSSRVWPGQAWAGEPLSPLGFTGDALSPTTLAWAAAPQEPDAAGAGSAGGTKAEQSAAVGCTSPPIPAPAGPAHTVLRVQRPCRYFHTGFCRDGGACRFAHSPGEGAAPLRPPRASTPPLPPLAASFAPLPSSAAAALTAGFAFGAPGAKEFLGGALRPAMGRLCPGLLGAAATGCRSDAL